MSAFAIGLQETQTRRLVLRVAVVVVLTAAAGALVSYAPAQPQVVKVGLVPLVGAALLLLAVRLPVSVLPLAVVVGLLGLGNLELSRIVPIPVLGGQEKWVLLILAGVVVLGAAIDASAPTRPTWPAVLPLGGLFLAICTGSLFYAADRELAWAALVHQVVQMAALAAGFFCIRRRREAEALVACLAVAGALSAALGMWQFLTPAAFNNVFGRFASSDMRFLMDYWALDVGRVGALWVHAPPFAAFLSALLPASLYLWLRHNTLSRALFAIAGFILVMVTLVLTGTRMEFIGAVVGVVVMLAAWGVRPKRLDRVRSGALPALVGAVVLATVLSSQGSGESNAVGRLLGLFGDEARTSESVGNRLLIYGTLVETWQSNPLLGAGLGNTRSAVEDLTTHNTSPHSYWLGLLAETGLIGTGLVVLMLAAMVPHYRRLLRGPSGSVRRAFASFALAASTALLVGSLFDNATLVWQTGVLFWLLQGIVLSLSLRGEDDPDADIDATEPSAAEAPHAG